MKLLLACVNSAKSLIGYDCEEEKIFWSIPSNVTRVCSACYDGSDLLISSDNCVRRLTNSGCQRIEMRGRYDALAHSVRVVGEDLIGVVDTGNSQVVVMKRDGQLGAILRPLEVWEDYPRDAIHLNDFAATPYGILASCFGYRPWRKVAENVSWEHWASGGYGLILNLTGADGKGIGRVVGCGFDQPHSLHYVPPNHLYLCSSGTGIFHMCELDRGGLVRQRREYEITRDHFLRGACRTDTGWFLGGSRVRHGKKIADRIEIYHLEEPSGKVARRSIDCAGEIYDILPWRDDLLQPILRQNFPEHPV